jgi:hypothetical protein
MNSAIEKRISRLENERTRIGRYIVLYHHVGDDTAAKDRQLAEVVRMTGQPRTAADTVVVIRRFGDGPLPRPSVDGVRLPDVLK